MGKTVARLFTQFQPENYSLTLVLDKEKMTFSGTVTIRGKKIGRPSQRITLHAKDLKVISATLTKLDKKGEQKLDVDRINLQKSYDELRLHSKQMLYAGEYAVTLEFSAEITRGMTGIYPCFFEIKGKEHALLMTQFESHYARQAFPCIDEPEAKATYDLTLDTVGDEVVLANTPIQKQSKKDGHLITSFETTPKMSSYLLAFAVGELQSKTTKTKRGTDVSVWATIAQPAAALDYPLDVSKQSIEFFEDYFGIDYPLTKLDHLAVPDFAAGAMENWGLITYRERALLAYPGETGQSLHEYIAMVIAHETSHQWFGNLVTMKWWDDLWLNESFANMMEYQAVDAMYPEWHIWNTFIAQEGLSALRRDATYGVQAVKLSEGVRHPDEINTLFDPSIVYAKGGRLLYMLKSFLGEDDFRKGLSLYFKKHAYGNTTGDDLWAALGQASGKDIGKFMNPWLEQAGFPVVSITQDGTKVSLVQEHFQDNPKKVDPHRLWPIPLFPSSGTQDTTMHGSKEELTAPDDITLLINTGARGHYLVRYMSDAQKQAVIEQVENQSLGEADRLMLLNGGSMLARAGYEPYSSVLTMLSAYEDEASEPVWDMIALILSETRRFIDLDQTLEDKIKQLIRKLIIKQYEHLGWEEKPDEPTSDQKLRATVIGLGAYAEEPSIVERALKLFETYKKAPADVPAELRGIAFVVPTKEHTPGAFKYLLDLHDETNNSDLKSDISGALTATRNLAEAHKLLARLKDPKLVKPQDAAHWLVYLLRNRYIRDSAWEWFVTNWEWIEETYSQDKSYDMFPRYAASMVNTKAWAKKYMSFFKPKEKELLLKRNIAMGLEEIAARVEWLERDQAAVQEFFK